jgi:hypothetical protein
MNMNVHSSVPEAWLAYCGLCLFLDLIASFAVFLTSYSFALIDEFSSTLSDQVSQSSQWQDERSGLYSAPVASRSLLYSEKLNAFIGDVETNFKSQKSLVPLYVKRTFGSLATQYSVFFCICFVFVIYLIFGTTNMAAFSKFMLLLFGLITFVTIKTGIVVFFLQRFSEIGKNDAILFNMKLNQ